MFTKQHDSSVLRHSSPCFRYVSANFAAPNGKKYEQFKAFLILRHSADSLTSCQGTAHDGKSKHWLFSHDSLHWQPVTIPHDWAISGPFQTKVIERNGIRQVVAKSGKTGALPTDGEGWYKTTWRQTKSGSQTYIIFDGAMAEPEVEVNGKEAGHWYYGYSAFKIDITPLVRKGENTIVVRLRNLPESSRWYPGAGLYRPVELVTAPTVNIDSWGTFFHTIQADSAKAHVSIETRLNGYDGTKKFSVNLSLKDAKGNLVAQASAAPDTEGHCRQTMSIPTPRLWSPETPYLYSLVTTLTKGPKIIDQTTTTVGIRTISFDSINGFRLNCQTRKFKGVCLHHDLGPLGTALNKAALIRQVKILKDMGADAIRTSHNPPSQMQMEVYDSLGMMVMAESFDMWEEGKVENGYAHGFKEWSDRDLTNLILHHRNHPSIMMWSIGNEIREQRTAKGVAIASHLQDICHRLDPSRPVTCGINRSEEAARVGFAQVFDIPGFNYGVRRYDRLLKQCPRGFILGTETASSVSSRGIYKFPVDFHPATDKNGDGQVSGYDTEWCSWGNIPEADFTRQENPKVIGQFVWSGFDYLGEPTPYKDDYLSRSSYFGTVDLAGIPKDRYYLYRSVWNKHSHTLHLLPHWTWPGREGQVTPVFVYTDYPSAELFINGKSQGRLTKAPLSQAMAYDSLPCTPDNAVKRMESYRLMWMNTVYEPGELKVVAYDGQGKPCEEKTIKTAGEASTIKLTADRTVLNADSDDLSYITVSIVDSAGTELSTATDNIEVEVSGAGTFRGICNGDATSLENMTKPHMRLFAGKLVITVQSGDRPGNILVKVKDKGLSEAINILVDD